MLELSSTTNVLIVDSNKLASKVLKLWLGMKNIPCKIVSNTIDAAKALEDEQFVKHLSLVITDMYFSRGLSGKELADRVKSLNPSAFIVIVINKKVPVDIKLLSKLSGYKYIMYSALTAYTESITRSVA